MRKTSQALLRHGKALPYIGLACTSLFWSGNALVARGFSADIEPLALAFHRWLACALLISPFIIRAFYRHWQTIHRNGYKVILLAVLSVTTFNSLLYLSAQYTTALNITLVNSLMPITTMVLAIPIFKQRISAKNGFGVALAFLGALWVILRGDTTTLYSLSINQGDAIMAVAMVVWSVYSLLLRKWSIAIPGFDLFAILTGIGVVILIPFYLWEYQTSGGTVWTAEISAVILYVAVFPSLLAYLFWNYGVAQTSPSTAAMFAYLTPLITAALGIPLLQEPPHWYHLSGGVAILAGLWLTYDIGSKPSPSSPTRLY